MTRQSQPMPKTYRAGVLVATAASLALLSACRVLGSVDVSVVAWEGDIIPPDGVAAPSGIAAALSQGGITHASIEISGGPEGSAIYQWRIRGGSCADPGALVGGPAQYTDLEHESPGSTTEDAVLSDRMIEDRTYNVVLLRADHAAEIACGQLERI